ncbi:YkvA family protein [Neobacillus dielmonensis]|uniref:YkvA family protein n=1 Tax=Neobacillus dielmonensis TaxID=1347369 RepID=UPI0005A72062|nr:YkvA family protein [Neobacillus dielmonensis]
MDSKFEDGYKKYESKASEYMNDKEKANGLLKQAIHKANDKKSKLSEVWDKLQLLFEVFRAWIKGEYKEIPTRSIIMIIAGILYFVSPVDLVPDFIAGLGLVDDAAVIGFVLKSISKDLEKFKSWKEQEEST